MSQMTPINVLFIPFLPLVLLDKFDLEKINTISMSLQYTFLMMLMFIPFIVISALLLPFAYVKSMIFKIQQLFEAQTTLQILYKSYVVISFILMGWLMMCLTFLADCVYFWINNFKTKE